MNILKLFGKKQPTLEQVEHDPTILTKPDRADAIRNALAMTFQGHEPKQTATMDAAPVFGNQGISQTVPEQLLNWYASQSFIGFTSCMIMAQHWLISAACEMPVSDALRKGWKISGNDGNAVPVEILAWLKKIDKRVKIKDVAKNFGTFGRVYGYRVAIFLIEGYTAEDYAAPFNPDGIKPNSYIGISQPDPYYVVPVITNYDAASIDYLEPEFYQVGGIKYHKTHCVVFRHCDTIGQLLKPVYLYGSASLPQQIYEQVYQAGLAAGEGNKLLMTKRLWVQNTDISAMIANQYEAQQQLEYITQQRSNFGVQLIDSDDSVQQLETALSEVTNTIAQQYQFVAAVARIPVNKLMQTQLSGFAASGEAEEAVYHESLETLQDKILPLIEKHTLYSIKSMGIDEFEYDVVFNPLDCLTEVEQATVNQTRAATAQILITVGAIDAAEERARLIADPDSGYAGLDEVIADTANYDDDNEIEDNGINDDTGT